MDLGRDAPAFLLLGLDRPPNEVREGRLLLLERSKDVRMLDRGGDERGRAAQELDVALREIAALAPVHVERAHELAGPRHERHREQRGEFLAAQLGDVLVARVGELVLRDDDDLPVLRHPTRDALPHAKRDSSHGVLEAVGGRAQREAPALGVPQMEEDGLSSSRLPDERDGLAKDHVQVEARGDGLDDPVQKPVLDLDPIVEHGHDGSWYGRVHGDRESPARLSPRRRRGAYPNGGVGR